MKEFLIGGVYDIGVDEKYAKKYVVLAQNGNDVILHNPSQYSHNSINNHSEFKEILIAGIQEEKIRPNFKQFIQISTSGKDYPVYIFGYLGQIDEEILEKIRIIGRKVHDWM